MVLCFAVKEDKEELKELWKKGFGDSSSFTDWFFRERFLPQNTAVIKEEGKIVSMAFYTLFDVGLAGHKIPVAFLSGVYTVPEKRGRGYMKKTVTALENAARKNDAELILETPAIFDLYRSFGHKYVAFADKKTFSPIKKEALTHIDFYKFLPEMMELYNKMHSRHSLMVIRDEKLFTSRFNDYFSDGAYITGTFKNGKLTSYAAVYETKSKLYVPECIYEASPNDIITLLRSAGKHVEIKLPGSSPSVSGDILNAEKFLARFNLPFSFEISGSLLDENNGIFSLDKASHAPCLKAKSADILKLVCNSDKNGILFNSEKAKKAVFSAFKNNNCFTVEEY